MSATAGRSTRTRLIEVAERLFAERGIDAISVSEILEAAEQRNKNAVQYHFGGKDGLITAVAEHRSGALNLRRSELLADVRARRCGDDIHELSRVLVLPLAEVLDDDDNHFLGFLARYHLDRSRRQLVEAVDPRVIESYRDAFRLLRKASGFSRQQFEIRFGMALDMIFPVLAGRHAEERGPGEHALPSRELFIDNLVDCVAGCFGSPSRRS